MSDTAVIVRDPESGARATLFGGKVEDVARMAAIALGRDVDRELFTLSAGVEVLDSDELVGRMAPEYDLHRIGFVA